MSFTTEDIDGQVRMLEGGISMSVAMYAVMIQFLQANDRTDEKGRVSYLIDEQWHAAVTNLYGQSSSNKQRTTTRLRV
jgi:hypothetical protein